MPTNPQGVEPTDDLFDYARHQSHFMTCPYAQEHRKPRK